jgi:phosphoribosylanthranilate isomerase
MADTMDLMAVFRIKICGVTRAEDALAAARAGADAIGLNFYSESRRFVDPLRAANIAAHVPTGVAKVGVFVNPPIDDVRRQVDLLGLDFVQLHGDEPPSFLAQLHDLPIIRAFRLGPAGWLPLVNYLDECRRFDCCPAAILADAATAKGYGGTGTVSDWQIARQFHGLGVDLPFILAGGLNPSNVAEAIAAVKPFGVDVASGVESAAGTKDYGKIAAFASAARTAFRG